MNRKSQHGNTKQNIKIQVGEYKAENARLTYTSEKYKSGSKPRNTNRKSQVGKRNVQIGQIHFGKYTSENKIRKCNMENRKREFQSGEYKFGTLNSNK